MSSASTSSKIMVAYALPGLAMALIGIPLYVYIPKFYTDVMGADVAVIGAVVLLARIFDAFTDPLLGCLSDRTPGRYGRRRPYIALGSIAMALFMAALYAPPQGSPFFVTAWFTVNLLALGLFFTAVDVPWESLGPEITSDYRLRTKLYALRDGSVVLGTLIAAASPPIIAFLLDMPEGPAAERAKFAWFVGVYGPFTIVACWVCALLIKEKVDAVRPKRRHILKGLQLSLENRPFVILSAAFTVAAFGGNIPATLILYYCQYVLGIDNPELFLLIYMVTGVLFLPLWVKLADRIGRKRAWLWSMALNTLAFTGVFFLGKGDVVAYGVMTFFSGIGLGATLALPAAMQADVVDYDELLTGERREGQYIGVWSVLKKVSSALGMGLALLILGHSGYDPGAEQNDSVVFTLRVLYALIPCLGNIAAILIAMRYPINNEEHTAILDAVEKRKQGRAVADPLRPETILHPEKTAAGQP